MKVRSSITLTDTLLTEIDKVSKHNRSEFIENAIRFYLIRTHRAERDKRDTIQIDKAADRLNKEAKDVLDFQVAL